MTMTKPVTFRIKNQNFIYEYHHLDGDNYLVKSWFEGIEQKDKIVSKKEAMMTYDYCSSMWIDFDVEVIK